MAQVDPGVGQLLCRLAHPLEDGLRLYIHNGEPNRQQTGTVRRALSPKHCPGPGPQQGQQGGEGRGGGTWAAAQRQREDGVSVGGTRVLSGT